MRENIFRNSFARSVRRLRRERGFTQRALARNAGITEKYVSRIELGLVTPSSLVAFRLAAALELDVGQLVSLRARPSSRAFVAIARLLRERPEQEVDRARRILIELFR